MNALEAVQRLRDRLAAGDAGAVEKLFASRAHLRVGQGPGVPWRAADGPGAFFRTLLDEVELDAHLDRVLRGEDPDEAVLFGTSTGRVRRTGRTYRTDFALHVRVVDGLITQYHLYEDTAAVSAAFTG